MNHGEKEKHVFSNELDKGLEILRKSKAATVFVTNGSDSDFVDAEFKRLLNSSRELMKVRIFFMVVHCSSFCMEAEYIGTTKIHALFMISSDHSDMRREYSS